MKRVNLLIAILCVGVFSPVLAAEPRIEERPDSFVRVIKNDDGSVCRYEPEQSNNGKKKGLVRTMLDPEGRVIAKTVYFFGKYGQLVSCKVSDGRGNEMYKVRYAYDPETANLMEERMYDSRVIDPKTNDNEVVRRFLYSYDEYGNRSKPVSIVLKEGVKIENRHKFASPTLPHEQIMQDMNLNKVSGAKK